MTPENRLKDEIEQVGIEAWTSSSYRPGLVKHIVLFRYIDGVTDAQKGEIIRRFRALKDSLRDNQPYILAIDAGRQNSEEGLEQGYQQGFIVTFASEGDRNYYVGEPLVTDPRYYDRQHAAFKQFIRPYLMVNAGVLVFDFSLNEGASC
ncbi:Dabb family protein [Providencia alcalifaciens]|uniref:Dabb family protein n=1 Tax=Providencia alcalifaciens TaxID=126385 RepID=UPI002B061AF7|nr:Dabb family protein [Providencia alcalifaciens]